MSDIPSDAPRQRSKAGFAAAMVVFGLLIVGAITIWNFQQKVARARLDLLRTVEQALALYAEATGRAPPRDDWRTTLARFDGLSAAARQTLGGIPPGAIFWNPASQPAGRAVVLFESPRAVGGADCWAIYADGGSALLAPAALREAVTADWTGDERALREIFPPP
jgi:hypothetical protein